MQTTALEAEHWAAMAPSLDTFEGLAKQAFERLPEEFRRQCGSIVFRIEDFPDDEVMRDLELDHEYELLGLFTGIGLPEQGASPVSGLLPSMICLYRRPILDAWAEGEETLGAIVMHVLVHEIGHHFGFSDEDMERIEREALV